MTHSLPNELTAHVFAADNYRVQTQNADAKNKRLDSFASELIEAGRSSGAREFKQRRHLLDTDDLKVEEINAVMEVARICKKNALEHKLHINVLSANTVATIFYEGSTRTKCSFQLAAYNLGARFLNLDVSTSSVQKGETLYDTASTLIAMGTDCVIQRHSGSGSCQELAKLVPAGVSVLNAGDGWHAHPTQALLDLFTMLEIQDSVQGRKIAIVGDIKHSRVARSNIKLLVRLGADVHVCAPPGLMPCEIREMGVQSHLQLEEAITDADFVMALRIQKERMEEGLIPSLADYTKLFRIDHDRLKLAKPDVRLLHPGPFNRNVEITSEVADDPHISLITTQVTNGIAVRMAALFLLLNEVCD